MANLFVVGEISSAHNFGGWSFFCTYEIVTGNEWDTIEGSTAGSTHIMWNHRDGVSWSMPLDVNFHFNAVQGWPKITVRVWQVDWYGRKDLMGYGVAFVPMPTEGEVSVEIPTWKPTYWKASGLTRMYYQMRQMVMGGNPVLRDESLIENNDNRYKLHTIASGTVKLKLNVLCQNASAVGLKFE